MAANDWTPEFMSLLGSETEEIERPPSQPIGQMRDPFDGTLNFPPESSVISAQPDVMSGAPVFKGTRVLAQILIEYLKAGDSIDDFLEGFPSVSREQVIAFLEEIKARVLGTG
ncbi:MAG: hypothetical protein QOE68_3417 [Thermoanaerobaculia bacterium]|jgi:uncharacterized protein (DUF433 family)|nr:hypothetical protein [Thermoanaerobaculia bacterium]